MSYSVTAALTIPLQTYLRESNMSFWPMLLDLPIEPSAGYLPSGVIKHTEEAESLIPGEIFQVQIVQ